MKKFTLSVACICLASSMALGQQMPKKMMPALGPIHSANGMTLPKDTFVTAVKSVFIKKDKAYDGDDKIFNPRKQSINMQRYNFIFRYGLGSGFDLRFLVPAFNKKLDMFNPRARTWGHFKNQGVGDMRAFLRYQLTSQKKGDSFFSAIDLGLELPTGDTNDDFYFENGIKLPNHNPLGMQTGDGSIDPILGLSATKLMGKHRLDGSMMYFFNQKGKNKFKKGDHFQYNLSYGFKLHPMFMPNVELNGKYFGKNELRGKKQNNTGGNEVFLTPGFSSNLGKVKVFAGYSFPIYRDLNKGALGTKNMITLKLSYKW